MEFFSDIKKEQYAKYLVQELKNRVNGMIALKDAIQFVDILFKYPKLGKNSTLDAFDVFVGDVVKKYDVIQSMTIVLFLMGVLNAHGIITQTELESMNKNFTNEIKNILLNQ